MTMRIVGAVVGLALLHVPAPLPAQQSAAVRVDEVRREPLVQTIPVIGRMVARRAGALASRIDGPVLEVRVAVGDRVEPGDLIARLDPVTPAAQRDLAAARVGEAEASLATSKAQYALANQEVIRLEKLKDSAATTRASFDDARQNRAIASARIVEAEAALIAARAELRVAEIDLESTEIRAPYAGVVTKRLIEIGAFVRAGQEIAQLVSDGLLEVEADVPAERLAALLPGVRVEVDLGDQGRHDALVRAVIPEENPQTRTRAVRFTPGFEPAGMRLAVGQPATVFVPIGEPREVVSVHKDAVLHVPDGAMVYVVNDDTAQPRPVQLGESVGNRIEVVAGLDPGDRVVVRGNERLIPNQPVQVEPAS